MEKTTIFNSVKRKLLESVCNEGNTLLDVSVGKAGDIHKWFDLKLSFILGQDYSQDNIVNPDNGACVRNINKKRDTIRKKLDKYPTIFFIWGIANAAVMLFIRTLKTGR